MRLMNRPYYTNSTLQLNFDPVFVMQYIELNACVFHEPSNCGCVCNNVDKFVWVFE